MVAQGLVLQQRARLDVEARARNLPVRKVDQGRAELARPCAAIQTEKRSRGCVLLSAEVPARLDPCYA
jgi:hypothetical protein